MKKNDNVVVQLSEINRTLATILANTQIFVPVASAVGITSNLSSQTAMILQELYLADNECLFFENYDQGVVLQIGNSVLRL